MFCSNCPNEIITLLFHDEDLVCRDCWTKLYGNQPILDDTSYSYVHSDGSPVLPNVSRPDLGVHDFSLQEVKE